MNAFKLFFVVGFLTLILTAVKAAETNAGVANTPSSFADAEAWNIGVQDSYTLTDVASTRAVFSHNFGSILYVTAKPLSTSLQDMANPQAFLTVRSLSDWQILSQIKLPVGPGGDFACSPDGKKIVYGPIYDNHKTSLLFVDLDTSKTILVGLTNQLGNVSQIFWPNPTNVFLAPSYCINLDSLEVSDLPNALLESAIKDERPQKMKNCVLDVSKYNVPGYDANITISSTTDRPYTKVLYAGHQKSMQEYSGLQSFDSISWSPHFQYILLRGQKLAYSYDERAPVILLHLGLMPTPRLDFEIRDLAQSLTDSQKRQLKQAFVEGKRIWANVYGERINPLNDKLLGPDSGSYKGQGFLTQIEPVFKFKFTFEVQPAALSNVVSDFQVGNEWNWGNQVWGQLVRDGEGDKSDFNSINTEAQRSEQSVQGAEAAGASDNAAAASKQVDETQQRDKLWHNFIQEFPDSSYSRTVVYHYGTSLPEAQEETLKALKSFFCVWKLQKETKPDERTILMTLAPAGMTAKMGYGRNSALLLTQLEDGLVEMRIKTWVYQQGSMNPNAMRRALKSQSDNLLVGLKVHVGDPQIVSDTGI